MLWQTILGSLMTVCISVIVNTYLFGKRTGNQETKMESLVDDCKSLKDDVKKIRSAFEAYTGISVEGDNFRPRRRGEHD
jgi:hypothetical protein